MMPPPLFLVAAEPAQLKPLEQRNQDFCGRRQTTTRLSL